MKPMGPVWHKFVAVTLTLLLAGAAQACLCLGMDGAGVGAPATTSAIPADPHACCRDQAAPAAAPVAPAGDDDPCDDCNLRHPRVTMAAETPAAVPAFDFDVAVASATDTAALLARVARPACGVTDDVPIPPLLRDLYHSFCLLTV